MAMAPPLTLTLLVSQPRSLLTAQANEAFAAQASSQDKEFCVLEGGHIGMLAGAEARQGLWLKVHRWLEARSQ